MKVNEKPVVVEQLFDNPLNEVWKAITEVDLMTQWFFENIPDFKPQIGFKTEFNVQASSRDFMHLWTISEVIPNKKLVCNWQYEGLKGNSYVTFELFEIDDRTKLVVSTEVVEDFDDSIPEFQRESCVGGWNYFIKDRLTTYLRS